MTCQETYDLWAPVWEKEPELRIGDIRMSVSGDGKLVRDNGCISQSDATSIINWTALEWLVKKGWVLCYAEGIKKWFVLAPGDSIGLQANSTGHYDTPTKALNAACWAVLEME